MAEDELAEYLGIAQMEEDEGYASLLDQVLEGYESEADSFLSDTNSIFSRDDLVSSDDDDAYLSDADSFFFDQESLD